VLDALATDALLFVNLIAVVKLSVLDATDWQLPVNAAKFPSTLVAETTDCAELFNFIEVVKFAVLDDTAEYAPLKLLPVVKEADTATTAVAAIATVILVVRLDVNVTIDCAEPFSAVADPDRLPNVVTTADAEPDKDMEVVRLPVTDTVFVLTEERLIPVVMLPVELTEAEDVELNGIPVVKLAIAVVVFCTVANNSIDALASKNQSFQIVFSVVSKSPC
jgi:hypothetical protein